MLIERSRSQLLVIDLQEKLAPAIHAGEEIIANSCRLLAGASQLGVPAYVSEHCVRALGTSVAAVRQSAVDACFFEKSHFSCAAEPGVLKMLRQPGRPQLILTGSEAHVCVLQSALGLQAAGFDVFVVRDAASSRTRENREAGFDRLRAAGVHIVSSEMVLFEWLHRAGTDEFRQVLPLIK